MTKPPQTTSAPEAQTKPPITAPNMREFTLNSPEAWDLFRPEPSMLPHFPRHRHNPIERDEG